MELIKKQLILIICAAVGLLSLAGVVLGVLQFGKVQSITQKAKTATSTLEALARGKSVEGQGRAMIPNEQAIEILRKRRNMIETRFYAVLEESLQKNIGLDPNTGEIRSAPLLEGVFPEFTAAHKPFDFRDAYNEAIDQLLKRLQAGTPPTPEEIAQYEEQEQQNLGFLASDESFREGIGDTDLTGSRRRPRGAGTDWVRAMAVDRAERERAESIKVYADRNSLDVDPTVADKKLPSPPELEQMWWAQVSLWIQKDLVEAIAEVNADAKNVGESAVKRIDDITVVPQYVVEGGQGRRSGAEGFDESFTGRACNELYDVVRFSMTVVVDSTRLMELIDAIYRQNFMTLYAWEIEAVETAEPVRGSSVRGQGGGYRFGPDPVVKATLWWERYFLRDYYHYGIIGYGVNEQTGKAFVRLLERDAQGNHKIKELDDPHDRSDLPGLMPKSLREQLAAATDRGGGDRRGRGSARGRATGRGRGRQRSRNVVDED